MKSKPILLGFVALLLVCVNAHGNLRTWSDASGKFNIEAELRQVEGGNAILRSENGKEITVPLAKLSESDRKFVERYLAQQEKQQKAEDDPRRDSGDEQTLLELEELTLLFYQDLRTRDRSVAGDLLTSEAIKSLGKAKKPLLALPTPDKGRSSIKPGVAELDGSVAAVPMAVRAGGKMYDTKLHFRQDDGAWGVFAISATFPDGEKTINFEAAPRTGGGSSRTDMIGKEASLSGVKLNGKPFDLSSMRGKVVLIDFWATWCGPCRAEIPNIRQNYQQYHKAGFEVVAVSIDRDLNRLSEFVAKEKMPWVVLADKHPDNPRSMAGAFGVSGIPAFFLIDQQGKVAAVNCRGGALGRELARLLPRGG